MNKESWNATISSAYKWYLLQWLCPGQGMAWGWIVTEGHQSCRSIQRLQSKLSMCFKEKLKQNVKCFSRVLRVLLRRLKICRAGSGIWHRMEVGFFFFFNITWKGCSNRTYKSSCFWNPEKPLLCICMLFWFFKNGIEWYQIYLLQLKY